MTYVAVLHVALERDPVQPIVVYVASHGFHCGRTREVRAVVQSAQARRGAALKNDDWLLPKPAPTSIFRALPEGGVLFSTSSEVYFGVNLVGARIWELLPPVHRTFNQLCDSLSAQFSDVSDDIIRGDAGRFLEHLLSNGLVIETKPEDHSPDGSGP